MQSLCPPKHFSFPALLLDFSGITILFARERPAYICAPVSPHLWLRTLFHQDPQT